MKHILTLLSICILYACTDSKKERPQTAIDTGREFIRASLNGNFETADALLLKDSSNRQLFESFKIYYGKMPQETKNQYREASYEINKLLEVDDSTTLINYSNSYMHKPMDIKVVRKDGLWWVDFRYTYSDNLPID